MFFWFWALVLNRVRVRVTEPLYSISHTKIIFRAYVPGPNERTNISRTTERRETPPAKTTHLCEALLEVVVQDVRLLRHDRQRDVIPHAERALLAGLGHVGDLPRAPLFGGKGVKRGREGVFSKILLGVS